MKRIGLMVFSLLLILFLSVQSVFSFYEFIILLEVPKEEFDEYKKLNDEETRLIEYKDSDQDLQNKLQILRQINWTREQYKVPELKLDILACRIANKQARESCENGYVSHWNMAGEKPYHRYALAGGVDHVSENSSGYFSSDTIDKNKVLHFSFYAHDLFMKEVPPDDGHKLNVIDPDHTHVGVGYWISGGHFRYYEEYVDRHLEFMTCEHEAKPNEPIRITVKPLSPGHFLYAVIAYFEPFPGPLSVARLMSTGSYPDYSNQKAFIKWPTDIKRNEDGSYTIDVTFASPGLYYIKIYLDTKEYNGGPMSTKGKISASGLVIRVDT